MRRRSHAGIRALVLTSAIYLGLPVVCQDKGLEPLPTGQVVNVTCADDSSQSYALYLPSAYSQARRWPIIYFFDPGGRGRLPVELYKDIAEKYGLAIAGSNNSRNFSGDLSKSLGALWKDTHLRLALDEHRIYTSGFSGGARAAGTMALGCPPCKIAGVIAQGAGYPSGRDASNDRLLYFFAVGNRDFNWPEIVMIRRAREQEGLPYRVRVFAGTHQWAPAAIIEDAVEWLMVRAMQAGDLPQDSAFIDRRFRAAQAEADDAEWKSDAIAQFNAYRSLTSDFVGLRDVTEYEKKLAVLRKSGSLKTALNSEQEQIADQLRLKNEISPMVQAYISGSADDPLTLGNAILQAMRRLQEESEHAKSDTQRVVAKRALDSLWIDGIESGQRALESRHFEAAEVCFQLMSRVRDDPWPAFLLAETHAAAGNRKQAIKDLREAVHRGLADAEVIESDSRLQGLKSDPDFQRLIEGMRHQ
jgi:dienelactone hydrolase